MSDGSFDTEYFVVNDAGALASCNQRHFEQWMKERANMNDVPHRIYLQCYEDGELLNPPHDDVTWCVDRINHDDEEYTRADIVATVIAQLERQVRDLEGMLTECKEEYAKLAFETSREIGNLQRKQVNRSE